MYSIQQQQGQQQQGGNRPLQQQQSGQQQKKKTNCGKCSAAGQAKQDAREQRHANMHSNEAPTASFTFATSLPDDPIIVSTGPTVVNLRCSAHITSEAHYGLPAFPQTKRTISLAHHIGVTPTTETVHHLDKVVNRASCAPAPYVNIGDYDFGAPGPSCPPGYETHEQDTAVHQLSPSFSATFGLDVPSYKDAMTDDGASLLSRLHPEPDPASLMPIDDDDVVSINSGQAEAGEFYSDANAFFATKENLYEEMPYKEYYDLKGGAEEFEYVLSQCTHLTDTDERSYLPQYVDYILSSVEDSESLIDSCTSATSYTMCDCCDNHTTKGKGKAHEQKGEEDMWLLNSGASAHFTNNFNVFVEYQPYANPRHFQMENGLAPVLGEDSVLICFNGSIVNLSPTIYMPICTFQLVSLGTLLKDNCLYAQSTEGYIHIIDDCTKCDIISFHTHGDSIMYWVRAPPVHDIISANIDMIAIDLHCPDLDTPLRMFLEPRTNM